MLWLIKIFYIFLGCLYALLALLAFILSLPFILVVLFYLGVAAPLLFMINFIFPISFLLSPEMAKNGLNGLINSTRFLLGKSTASFHIAKDEI